MISLCKGNMSLSHYAQGVGQGNPKITFYGDWKVNSAKEDS